jgi:tetratricopeptide (TPR) repeat protein
VARKGSRYLPSISEAVARGLDLLVSRPSRKVLEPVCDRLVRSSPEQRKFQQRNSRIAARPEVVERLVERSFALRRINPGNALKLAQVAVELAGGLSRAEVPSRLAADSLAHSWGNLGNSLRITGDLLAAERAWRKAGRYLAVGTGDALLAAHLLWLRALLGTDQRKFDEAIELLRAASLLYKDLDCEHLVGRAQLSLSRVLFEAGRIPEALEAMAAGGRKVNLDEDPQLGLELFHNAVLYLTEMGDWQMALHVLRYYGWMYRWAEPLVRLRGLWVRGRLFATLGNWKAATGCFERVRRAWVQYKMPYDAGLVTLELAHAWLQRGWPDKVAQLAREMYPMFLSQDISREASATLILFAQAAQQKTLTCEAVSRLTAQLRSQPATARPEPADEDID